MRQPNLGRTDAGYCTDVGDQGRSKSRKTKFTNICCIPREAMQFIGVKNWGLA